MYINILLYIVGATKMSDICSNAFLESKAKKILDFENNQYPMDITNILEYFVLPYLLDSGKQFNTKDTYCLKLSKTSI